MRPNSYVLCSNDSFEVGCFQPKSEVTHCYLQLPTKLWQDEKVNTETSAAAASEQIFTGVNPWSSRPDMLWASARANGPYQRHPGLTSSNDISVLLYTSCSETASLYVECTRQQMAFV